jgi:hypothetical protein
MKQGFLFFERKAHSCEKCHRQKANRLIVIFPRIDPQAMDAAKALGIEPYGDSTEVESRRSDGAGSRK